MSQLAPAADVLDHRFGAGQPMTLGVEEEYMLLDAHTFDLVQRVESILRAEEDGDFAALVSPELFESGVRRILRDGNGADRQLRVYAAGGDAAAVVRDIATVTQASEPPRVPRDGLIPA